MGIRGDEGGGPPGPRGAGAAEHYLEASGTWGLGTTRELCAGDGSGPGAEGLGLRSLSLGGLRSGAATIGEPEDAALGVRGLGCGRWLTDRGDVSAAEVVFCKANDQTGLAHPRVPDQQQLEEVVVGFGHGGHRGAGGGGRRDRRAGDGAAGSPGQEVFLPPRPGSGMEGRRHPSGPHPLPAHPLLAGPLPPASGSLSSAPDLAPQSRRGGWRWERSRSRDEQGRSEGARGRLGGGVALGATKPRAEGLQGAETLRASGTPGSRLPALSGGPTRFEESGTRRRGGCLSGGSAPWRSSVKQQRPPCAPLPRRPPRRCLPFPPRPRGASPSRRLREGGGRGRNRLAACSRRGARLGGTAGPRPPASRKGCAEAAGTPERGHRGCQDSWLCGWKPSTQGPLLWKGVRRAGRAPPGPLRAASQTSHRLCHFPELF